MSSGLHADWSGWHATQRVQQCYVLYLRHSLLIYHRYCSLMMAFRLPNSCLYKRRAQVFTVLGCGVGSPGPPFPTFQVNDEVVSSSGVEKSNDIDRQSPSDMAPHPRGTQTFISPLRKLVECYSIVPRAE
jgi:hypothetical protein